MSAGACAAAAWIKQQNAHDEHTMSVCNGAFTLANTGLLDGLSATTAAGLSAGIDDRAGRHWRGTLSLEAVPADAHQFVLRIATARAG
jgi:putative intracellular protease/amidase